MSPKNSRELVNFLFCVRSAIYDNGMKVYYHPRFRESYLKFSLLIRKKAERRERIFRLNPFDPRLQTHKLHGLLKRQWSFSVDDKYRILFEFDDGDVIFLDIGDHHLYK